MGFIDYGNRGGAAVRGLLKDSQRRELEKKDNRRLEKAGVLSPCDSVGLNINDMR